MVIYKNLSHATKTFYGVTFKPGEVHEVPGYIHHIKFRRLDKMPADTAKPQPTKAESKPAKPSKPVVSTPESTQINSKETKQEEVIPNGEHSDQ